MASLHPVPTSSFCTNRTKFSSKISALLHKLNIWDCGGNTENQHFLLPFKTYVYSLVISICELEVGGIMTRVAKKVGQYRRPKTPDAS